MTIQEFERMHRDLRSLNIECQNLLYITSREIVDKIRAEAMQCYQTVISGGGEANMGAIVRAISDSVLSVEK